MNRREFLKTSALSAAALSAGTAALADGPKLRKAVKIGMIKQGANLEEKFALIKKLGFEGLEMNAPDTQRDEAIKAAQKTGVIIHGVVCANHWNVRHSDPDPEVRSKAREFLKGAIADCKAYGGDVVLLVPGKVADPEKENFEQCWSRSQESIKQVLPYAKEQNVKIGIEVVWNNFITTPEQFIKYIDEFNDPIVGGYFDCSNMLKFGVPSAEWIRKLGKRMLKFDFKGFKKPDKWVAIGEGDEDWPEVLKALQEIGYNGWATSEVGGGGEKELAEIAERMDKVLGLKK